MSEEPHSTPTGWRRPVVRHSIQAIALFGLWLALSGHFEAEFLLIGALTSVGTAAFTHLLFRGTHEGRYQSAPGSVVWVLASIARFIVYMPWLAYQIAVSNLHVAYLVLHPKMPITPTLVQFRTSLVSETARVLLAQSITLTPGTVSVDATGDSLLVHALSGPSREGLESGATQSKIAWVFQEPGAERVHLVDIERQDQIPL